MYKGLTAQLPVAILGFTGTRNPSQRRPGQLAYVDGLDFEGGLLRKEGGASKINSSALAAGAVVMAGTSWVPTPGTYHDIVFLGDGSVRRDAGAGTFSTTLATGLNATRDPPPMFVSGGGEATGAAFHMFLFSPGNQVRQVTGAGATMSAITTPPADWATNFPTFGVLHAFRMWGGGNVNDPHRIYYSTLTNHEDWTGAGSGTLAIFPGEGERLVAGISFKGVLVLFKYPKGIYVVDTRNVDVATWTVQKLSGAVGTLNGHTAFHIENDVLYMDVGGSVHSLTSTNAFGDITTSDISRLADMGPFHKTNLNRSKMQRAVGIWYADKHQAWFAVPQTGSDDNNLRLIIDFSAPDLGPRFLLSRRDVVVSMWDRPDAGVAQEYPITGDASGFVRRMDTEARTKDGAAYPMVFETSDDDLASIDPQLKTKAKNGQFLELTSESLGDWNLTVEVYWDDVLHETLQFDMGAGAEVIGTFTLGTSTLGSEAIRSQRLRITGQGRRIKLVVKNEIAGQDVALAEFFLNFDVADERIRDAG